MNHANDYNATMDIQLIKQTLKQFDIKSKLLYRCPLAFMPYIDSSYVLTSCDTYEDVKTLIRCYVHDIVNAISESKNELVFLIIPDDIVLDTMFDEMFNTITSNDRNIHAVLDIESNKCNEFYKNYCWKTIQDYKSTNYIDEPVTREDQYNRFRQIVKENHERIVYLHKLLTQDITPCDIGMLNKLSIVLDSLCLSRKLTMDINKLFVEMCTYIDITNSLLKYTKRKSFNRLDNICAIVEHPVTVEKLKQKYIYYKEYHTHYHYEYEYVIGDSETFIKVKCVIPLPGEKACLPIKSPIEVFAILNEKSLYNIEEVESKEELNNLIQAHTHTHPILEQYERNKCFNSTCFHVRIKRVDNESDKETETYDFINE